jgi:hypothetical protein
MRQKRIVRLGSVCLSLAFVGYGLSEDSHARCDELEGRTVEAHLAYLERNRSTLSPACIAYAANQIGLRGYGAASKTLSKYLDYRMPDDPAMAHLPPISLASAPRYPAAEALFQLGKKAIPELIQVIASAETSQVARRNAIRTAFAIHREDVAESVRVLVRASKSFPDPQSRDRLYDAAREAAALCYGPMRNTCMNALQQE